jgi:hypothetical protein
MPSVSHRTVPELLTLQLILSHNHFALENFLRVAQLLSINCRFQTRRDTGSMRRTYLFMNNLEIKPLNKLHDSNPK